jgi:S1-C subfamily serine protease
VQIQDVTAALAAELDLDPDTGGALVVGLFPGGPAEEAGIEQGDVIVGIDGDEVVDVNDVNGILRDYDPGEIVEVEILRGSETELIEVELGQRPNTFG